MRHGPAAALRRRPAGCAWSACSRGCRLAGRSARRRWRAAVRERARWPRAPRRRGVSVAPGTVVFHGRRRRRHRDRRRAVIHAGIEVGERLRDRGRRRARQAPAAAARAPAPPGLELEPLVLGDGVTVCCGAVVYAGARIGAGAIIGDQARCASAPRSASATVVGRGSCVDFGARVGDRVLIQTGRLRDRRLGRRGRRLPRPRRADDQRRHDGPPPARRGAAARRSSGAPAGSAAARCCVPGVEIGEEAFVAAGAVVTRDVAAREVVMGVPARVVRQVPATRICSSAGAERWPAGATRAGDGVARAEPRRHAVGAGRSRSPPRARGRRPTSAIGTPTKSAMNWRYSRAAVGQIRLAAALA